MQKTITLKVSDEEVAALVEVFLAASENLYDEMLMEPEQKRTFRLFERIVDKVDKAYEKAIKSE